MNIEHNTRTLMVTLLDKTLELAVHEPNEQPSWRFMLEQLDMKIRRNAERISAEPIVPTVLRDEYRKEIDSVMLDNMHLAAKLEQVKSVLERSRSAYKEESEYSALLKQKLDELEQRLVSVIRRKSMN
jgi:exonuclease VII small subunit